MLQFMRKFAKSFIFKIFAYVLIAAFALTGVSAGFLADFSDNYLVKVGSEKIYPHTVQEQYSRVVQNLRTRGVDLSEEQLAAMGVSPEQVLQSIIQEKLVSKAVIDLGLSIGDDYIADEILKSPLFQKDGKFNQDRFQVFLYQKGMREANYVEALRNEISVNMLMAALLNNNVLNEKIKAEKLEELSEVRTVRTVTVPEGKKKFSGDVTDEALEEFYFENSFMFEVAEERSAEYFEVIGSEENEEETYEIVTKIEDELAGGSTLEEIAKLLNLDLKKNEVLYDESVTNLEVSDLFKETLLGLEEDEISGTVSDGDNYYFIKAAEVKKAHIPELEDIRSKVVAAYKEQQNRVATREFANSVYKEVKNKGDYRTVARKYGLKTKKLEKLKRNDFSVTSYDLLQDSFIAKNGDVFGVYENVDGSFDIAMLESVGETELSELDIQEYESKLKKEQETEVLNQYLRYLETKFPVTQNPNSQVQ